jgi:hypothetical protein
VEVIVLFPVLLQQAAAVVAHMELAQLVLLVWLVAQVGVVVSLIVVVL